MNDDDIKKQWAADSQQVVLQNLTRNVVIHKLNEGFARTKHNEALLYYQSQHWQLDGIASEALDEVINQLAIDHQRAMVLRAALQDELDNLLVATSLAGQTGVTLRREDLLKDATIYVHDTYQLPTGPSPLNILISHHRQQALEKANATDAETDDVKPRRRR